MNTFFNGKLKNTAQIWYFQTKIKSLIRVDYIYLYVIRALLCHIHSLETDSKRNKQQICGNIV